MWKRTLGWALLAGILALGCTRQAGPVPVSGTVETDEVHVGSRTGGRVGALHAGEGDPLMAGQLIAELSAPELLARREQVAAQLAEGVAGPRPQEIAEAAAETDALEAQLKLAREDFRRAQDLFTTRVNTAAEVERAEASLKTYERRLEAARQRLELLRAGTRPERLAAARAQLAELEAQVAELRVTAPAPSVLEVLSVKVGDVVQPGREVATLVLTNQLWVRVYVPQPWLGFLKLGEAVEIRADAFPERRFTGRIEQINRQAEFTPRNVQTADERIRQVFGVKVRLNPEEGLRAGMSVDALFPQVSPGVPPSSTP